MIVPYCRMYFINVTKVQAYISPHSFFHPNTASAPSDLDPGTFVAFLSPCSQILYFN